MSISFNQTQSNLRVPFIAVEFDNTRASQGPALLAYKALLIGQKTASGTATADTLTRITSADQAATLAGRGSQAARMARAWFANNKSTEVWIGVLADNGSGVAAAATLTVVGTATASGTLYLYVGGQRVTIGVTAGDTEDDVAAAIAAAFPSTSDYPVTGAVGGEGSEHIVTLTNRNKGTAGNDCDVRFNYQDGEKFPAGVGVEVVAMSSGATNPSLAGIIAAMGDTWFNIIAHPYTDATSLTALETELSSRFKPPRMIDGLAITSAAGTQSALGTIGDSRNSPHSCIVAQPGKKPLTPPAEFAAAVAGVVAFEGARDPALPFQTLEISGVLPPAEADRFTFQEQNLELYDGISTTRVAAGGVVQIDRLITTYQTNAAGAADTSFLDATTMLTLAYLRFSFRNGLLQQFPRCKLANDDARFGPGQVVMTPSRGRGYALTWFRQMESLGLVEGFAQFKQDLLVERNAQDPNRLDWLISPDIINQFIVGAAKVQFLL